MEIKIWNDTSNSVPTVWIHSFVGNGREVWEACHSLNCPPFNLVSISDSDLDSALTPWKATALRKGEADFGGEAEAHLNEILKHTIPEVEQQLPSPSAYWAMAGYSLAGLFTLWALWQTPVFSRLACVSASFWYPHFREFVHENPLEFTPECIYFSLGNKESKTKHPLLKTVDECTRDVFETLQKKVGSCIYEINEGNHFTNPPERMAKAILWMLQHENK